MRHKFSWLTVLTFLAVNEDGVSGLLLAEDGGLGLEGTDRSTKCGTVGLVVVLATLKVEFSREIAAHGLASSSEAEG
jgi:hypothetical protein